MAKQKLTPAENAANQPNANKGTSGFNKQYLKSQENRSKQLAANKASELTKKDS